MTKAAEGDCGAAPDVQALGRSTSAAVLGKGIRQVHYSLGWPFASKKDSEVTLPSAS